MENEDLVRMQLEPFSLRLVFSNTMLELGSPFVVISSEGKHKIDPSQRLGDITILWQLLEKKVLQVAWPDEMDGEISLTFEGGTELVIPPSDSFRGTISGRKDLRVEDF